MAKQEEVNRVANRVLATFDAAFTREVDRYEETRATMAEICGTALALAVSEIPEGFTQHELLGITLAVHREPGTVEKNLHKIREKQAAEAAEKEEQA